MLGERWWAEFEHGMDYTDGDERPFAWVELKKVGKAVGTHLEAMEMKRSDVPEEVILTLTESARVESCGIWGLEA